MHNEVNLHAISSGGDIKLALEVFADLFTTDEMAVGIVAPARERATGKGVLDTTRTNLLKSKYII